MEPLDGSALVAKSGILWLARKTREAKYVDAIVDSDENGILGFGKVLGIVKRAVGVANGKSCAFFSCAQPE